MTDMVDSSSGVASDGLAELEARLKKDLEWLGWPAASWLPPPREMAGQAVLDVAIIGAGQAGLAVAAVLAQQGIQAVVFDRAPAGQEGPWVTTARMETLRSPKELTGPALGLPNLTFRAWFEAQFGANGWALLDKIPRVQWMDYLRWYRHAMNVDVRNDTTITAIHPRADGLVALDVQAPAGATRLYTRRLVLATGRDGLGGAAVPAFVNSIDRSKWAHSSDEMDYRQLAGKRVGVVGAGASAMDSAATALESGAASVDLLVRRPDLPRVNKSKGGGGPGRAHGHYDLPDPWKWRMRHYVNVQQVPPPRGSTLRVSRHANARFHLGCPVFDVQQKGNVLHVLTAKGTFELDFLIVSTGFKIDWASRPELFIIAPHVRAWKDRFTPEAGQDDTELSDSPDLGPVFEFQEKTAGQCPGLERIHCFCYPATLSHGVVSGDIPAISEGARRLVNGIVSYFYREDIDYQYTELLAYAEPELLGDEWVNAPPL